MDTDAPVNLLLAVRASRSVDVFDAETMNLVAGGVSLASCYPDQPDDCREALANLARCGEHREGGGAAAAFVVRIADQ